MGGESSELGKCPDCGSERLVYGAIELDDTYTIYYPVKCKDCGYQGKEIYSLEFLKYERDR